MRSCFRAFVIVLAVNPLLLPGAPTDTAAASTAAPVAKRASVFYPARLIERARENMRRHAWAAEIGNPLIEAARPWMEMSDEQLWRLMFSNTIKRSWMVWSNGYCPACKKPVPMYNWEVDALNRPWKMRCPHCKELFPKNDFEKFYRSGLDEHHVFQPARADRKLLFNLEHPDPADPLHAFGVDDGEGYVQGPDRWRFIGAYLIYGQWKQGIVAGASRLAAAYVMSGNPAYAHKAGVLLDRVADLYPTFNFGKEGVMYEGPPARGYVSTWHDACVEVRDLAVAYDQVFEALRDDRELVAFASEKAKRYRLDNPKTSFADIQRNIERRILQDTLANRAKIESNYPQTDMALTMLKTVLAWPENRAEVLSLIDAMLQKATAVDGLSGEKGLTGYTCIAPHTMAELLGRYARVEPDFLKEAFQRQPRLRETYRFHLDTWCLGRFYPRIGDTGLFAAPTERYAGVGLSKNPGLDPSGFQFLWDLYERTGDADYVRALYQANGSSVEGLPYDLFAADPTGHQEQVRKVIAAAGTGIDPPSTNKRQWGMAVLRSGRGSDSRAVWLDYDSGGAHGHADGMTLGLFARGLDLLPDFGYPPVNHGGWGAPRAVWYTVTAAHGTVVVDNGNTRPGGGRCTLFGDGREFRVVRASAPDLIGGRQYERTLVMVDTGPRDFYLLDVFRVVGGSDHVKLTHGPFGDLVPEGLSLQPADAPPVSGASVQMRDFRVDASPRPGWVVDFRVQDHYKLLPAGSDVHLRQTELTAGAAAYTGRSWISAGGFTSPEEVWIPAVCVRRKATAAPLASVFVSVIEPYEKVSNIRRIRRLPLKTPQGTAWPESHVAVEVTSADGRRDLIIVADTENPLDLKPARTETRSFVLEEAAVRADGEVCFIRFDAAGRPDRVAACRAASVRVGDAEIRFKPEEDLIEQAWR